MRVVSADEIDAVLDFPSLVGALRRTFMSENGAPARHHHHVGPEGGRHATHLDGSNYRIWGDVLTD